MDIVEFDLNDGESDDEVNPPCWTTDPPRVSSSRTVVVITKKRRLNSDSTCCSTASLTKKQRLQLLHKTATAVLYHYGEKSRTLDPIHLQEAVIRLTGIKSSSKHTRRAISALLALLTFISDLNNINYERVKDVDRGVWEDIQDKAREICSESAEERKILAKFDVFVKAMKRNNVKLSQPSDDSPRPLSEAIIRLCNFDNDNHSAPSSTTRRHLTTTTTAFTEEEEEDDVEDED